MMGDRPSISRRAIVATAVVALIVMIAIVAINAPANWLALYLSRETRDVMLLADAQGTIWSGSAVVALGSPRGVRDDGPTPERLALPGRVTCTLEITRALAPVLHLTHDGVLLQPLAIRYVGGDLAVEPGAASLPASMLRLVGAPMNTLLPEGRCTLRWTELRFGRDGPPEGVGTLRVDGFALALSPVRPLGDYLLTWASGARGLTWQLATERGPLMLEGNGTFGDSIARARVVVRASTDAPNNVIAQLGVLLDMIGRRSPNEAIIEVGGRS
jgi:general secretion pathway protein N